MLLKEKSRVHFTRGKEVGVEVGVGGCGKQRSKISIHDRAILKL